MSRASEAAGVPGTPRGQGSCPQQGSDAHLGFQPHGPQRQAGTLDHVTSSAPLTTQATRDTRPQHPGFWRVLRMLAEEKCAEPAGGRGQVQRPCPDWATEAPAGCSGDAQGSSWPLHILTVQTSGPWCPSLRVRQGTGWFHSSTTSYPPLTGTRNSGQK